MNCALPFLVLCTRKMNQAVASFFFLNTLKTTFKSSIQSAGDNPNDEIPISNPQHSLVQTASALLTTDEAL